MAEPWVLDVRLPAGSSPDLDEVRAQLDVELRSGAVRAVVCHGEGLPGELSSVDALARLWLSVRRSGASFAVRGLRPELGELVELLGLGALLGVPQERRPR